MKIYDKNIFLFVVASIVILWQALLPGYILSLDMVFTPEMHTISEAGGFLNTLLVGGLLRSFCLVLPAWLIQKFILFFLFFNIGYLAYKFLPVGEDKNTRLFSALIYLSNPFVYSRFLAGHWMLLFAYALLPIFIYYLLALKDKFDLRSMFRLFIILFVIGLFSLHFLVISFAITFFWIFYLLARFLYQNEIAVARSLFFNFCIAVIFFLIVSGYWILPAFSRSAPIEARFGQEHWSAFSAGSYNNVGVLLNIASLNGFWGERNVWAGYFLWPQDSAVFWFAFLAVFVLVLLGICFGLRKKETRLLTVFFMILSAFSFVFATGVSDTVFKNFNLWMYEHIYFWSGFRDSQKFSGFLALGYAFLSSLGFSQIFSFLDDKKPALKERVLSFVFVIPIFFGLFVWGGFHGQIKSVWYPASWFEVQNIVRGDITGGRVLFLPWHGYLSFKFNNNLITANPFRTFFGEKVVAGRSVEIGDIYDQENNEEYSALDNLVREKVFLSANETVELLAKKNIKYIVYFRDIEKVDNLKYEFLNSEKIDLILNKDDLSLYEIKDLQR